MLSKPKADWRSTHFNPSNPETEVKNSKDLAL